MSDSAVTNYLQPHEGIQGVDRADDLLSLDEGAVLHRDVIRMVAHHLHSAVLVGNPAPKVARMYERISHPQIGDLVVERSSFWRPDADMRLKGFGLLIAHRQEWWSTDEEFEAHIAEERSVYEEIDDEFDEAELRSGRATDDAWYVQYGSAAGDVCRWTNCSFIVVPVADTFELAVGTRDERGVTLTRDDLLASFSDSGFELRTPTDEPDDRGSNGTS